MTDDGRDWVVQLVDAGVLVRTGADDGNGNPVYRLFAFPPGAEGQRLRALFDQNVVQHHDGQQRK